jgi:hypothetical protein
VFQKKAFDEIVASLTEHSLNQVAGKRLRHAEGPRQQLLRRALREQHLSPISQIARATLADAPGIDKALRMPPDNLSALKLVAEASAMRNAAVLYEAQFIEAGRPADFLTQLDAAAEAVRQSMLGKARNLGRQVGAGAGLERDIRRGRKVLDVLDTIVPATFLGDLNVLAKWRNAKRVRALPTTAAPVTTPARQSRRRLTRSRAFLSIEEVHDETRRRCSHGAVACHQRMVEQGGRQGDLEAPAEGRCGRGRACHSA